MRDERAAIRAIRDQIDRIDLDPAWLARDVLTPLRELTEIDDVVVYSLRDRTGHWALERYDATGTMARGSGLIRSFFDNVQHEPLYYDPAAPDPAQRNRVIDVMDWLISPEMWDRSPANHQILVPLDLGHAHHVRALLCDGARLLAWFGFMVPPPVDPRVLRILRPLVAPMRRRLLIEEQLVEYAYIRPAFSVMLDRIGGAAFVVDGKGAIREYNAAGGALLAERAREVRAALVDTIAGRAAGLRFELVVIGDMKLAVLQTSSVEQRIAMCVSVCAVKWGLTPRQVETLGLVARGLPNATIAATLKCSERTVELHVTALLGRASVENRASLIAVVLTTT
ncbi:hypothetical protein BH11MYX2_BH11MYX2_19070 [soil metagenome]